MLNNKVDLQGMRSPLHFMKGQRSKFLDDGEVGLTIAEIINNCYLNVRGRSDDANFVEGIDGVLNLELPITPGTFSANDLDTIFWLGPDEWLIISNQPANSLQLKLREALRGHIAVTDVSGGHTKIRLFGPSLPSVLQKASGYDFEAWLLDDTNQSRCAQTNFAKATALVALNEDNSFDVVVRRSFADYIAQWLLDAGRVQGCLVHK
jgi:heterotetrameric sarcosine oxidase gamma subunit